MGILNILLQLLTIPAILVGIVALFGLILQRKTLTQVVLGTAKTILGFLILNIGVSATTGGLANFDKLFKAAFGITGVYFDDNIAIGAVMGRIGREVGLVMVLGFLANVLIARFTKAKWIYLTGHKVWHLAGGIALVLLTLGVSGIPLVIIGALVLGLYMAIQPMLLQPYTRRVTGTDDYGVGHTMGSAYWVSSVVAKLVGNKEHSIEEISLPSTLEAFRDIAVAFSLIMFVMFAVPSIFAPEAAFQLAGTQHPIVWIVLQSLTAAGGVLVILQGVRMFIGELIPAFKGIALKLVPGAAPALDCPVVFPFAPTGVVVGLATGFVGWLVGMTLCRVLGLAVVPVPSMIALLFGCTAGAVYGNALGGARGSVAAGFVTGLLWPIAGALFYPVIPWAEYEVVGAALMTPDIYIVVTLIKVIGSIIRAILGLG
ncbi:MAG: PTS ascorbate transporter subunit IIC [Chloroflexi bacterium]|nr:PTS ascorbate transporter subunit IIC [Chloroflexota bacterium]